MGCLPAENANSNDGAATGPETCPRSQFSNLIGTQINAAALPLTLTYRVIWPDDVVTTDFVDDRLEIAVDGSGIVTGLRCG